MAAPKRKDSTIQLTTISSSLLHVNSIMLSFVMAVVCCGQTRNTFCHFFTVLQKWTIEKNDKPGYSSTFRLILAQHMLLYHKIPSFSMWKPALHVVVLTMFSWGKWRQRHFAHSELVRTNRNHKLVDHGFLCHNGGIEIETKITCCVDSRGRAT